MLRRARAADSQFEIIEPQWGSQEVLSGSCPGRFLGSFPGAHLRDLLGILLVILADLPDLRIMTQVQSDWKCRSSLIFGHRPRALVSDPLHSDCRGLPAADAERGDAAFQVLC